ncbi:Short-chain dehydrogenase/reductase SDR [Corchorus olitorius]|uniref:Short-chain dehydrogenase/reductase n=1 Tax=Corchorus olitorius TaxID=93759 RepID=A0A1R3K007_9ROSI|nr:Short-chain dehydrogenase/reductase SDR [Corchorus olitorius]
MANSPQRYAVVTGANKGIGLEISRQLASKGVMVILTARDEKRGLEAFEKLKESGLSDNNLVFHQLDVSDPASITNLADFVKNKFGKLDILVNNAGVGGTTVDYEALNAAKITATEADLANVWGKVLIQSYEAAEECLKINYFGAKRTAEALIPLLQFSDSPRIVNVSSHTGKLKNIPGEELRGVLRDVDTEDKLDGLILEFLKDFKENSLESKGWPPFLAAYTVSKVAMNVYTRILANKYPKFSINCVCPGFVKTDMNFNTGTQSVEEGAATPVKLALWPTNAPTGLFFFQGEPISYDD